MVYKVDDYLRNFKPWSGAKYTFEKLSDEELDTLDSMLEDIFDYSSVETMPTETSINDLLWFENDTIAEWLGYEDWEDLERVKAGDSEIEESFKALKGGQSLKESFSDFELSAVADAIEKFTDSAFKLAQLWETLSPGSDNEFNEGINELMSVEDYPSHFDASFDELCYEILAWKDAVIDKIDEYKKNK